jgi:hypothetical protein
MNLWRPYTKAMLTNPFLWFWAVAFMAFWVAIGAFVESQGIGPSHATVVAYTTSWYALIVLFSLSMLAVAIANSLTYGSSALAYAFRFTRLTPEGYLGSIVGGSAILGGVLSFALLGVTVGMFGSRFGSVLLPADPLGLLAVALLGGVFFMALSVTLILVVINYLGLRSASFVGFVPLLISFSLGNAQAYVALPRWLLYGSPFNDLASLLYQAYSGTPATVVLGTASAALDWSGLLLGVLLWTALLTGTSILLLRRIRARQLEEGRQI